MQLADVIIVMMGDQHRIDPNQRNFQRRQLAYDTAPGIYQYGIVANFDQQRRCSARHVGSRAASAQQRNGRHDQSITVPPSTDIVCPVTKQLPSEINHATVPVRSAGSNVRWIVC